MSKRRFRIVVLVALLAIGELAFWGIYGTVAGSIPESRFDLDLKEGTALVAPRTLDIVLAPALLGLIFWGIALVRKQDFSPTLKFLFGSGTVAFGSFGLAATIIAGSSLGIMLTGVGMAAVTFLCAMTGVGIGIRRCIPGFRNLAKWFAAGLQEV